MWNDDDRKWLYEKMKSNGIDTGSYDDFTNSLNNQEDRDWYYQKSVDMGLDVGSADDFMKMMVEPQESAQPQAPVQPQETIKSAEGQAPSDAVRAEYADTIMSDGEIVPGEKMGSNVGEYDMDAYAEKRQRMYKAGMTAGENIAQPFHKEIDSEIQKRKAATPKEQPLQTAEPTQVQEETLQAPQSAQETQTNYEPSGTPWLKENEPKPWENTPWNTRNVGDNKAVNEEWKAARQEQTATTQQLVSGTSSADAWKQNATAMRRMDNAEFQRRVRGEEFDNTDNNFETFYQTSVAPTFKTERARADEEGTKAAAQYPSVTASNGMTVPNVMAAAAYEKATDPAVVTQNVLANLDGNALSQYVERRMHVDEQPMMGGIERQLTEEELNLVRDLIAAENGDVVTKLQQRMYQDYINEGGNMTTAGYILGNGFRNSLLMRLQDAIVTRIAGSSGLRKQFLDMAYQRAGERAGAIARGVSGAVTMIADAPAFGVAGKVAAPVAKGVIGAAGKAIAGRAAGELGAAAAERFIVANSALGRTATAMAQSGLTFSGYDVMSEGVNQLQEGTFDAGKLVSSAVKGFKTGAAVGALGGVVGEVTKNLTGAARVATNIGGFAAEVGLFTGMQGLEMANALGVPISEVDWGALTIENAAMLGVLKLQSMPQRAQQAASLDMKLNTNDIESLRRRGYDFGSIPQGLKSLKTINSGDKVTARTSNQSNEKEVREMYLNALLDPDLPLNTKRKLRWYLEGEYTVPERVFGYKVEENDYDDASVFFTTYAADGSVIDVVRVPGADIARLEGKTQREMDFNRLDAYNRMLRSEHTNNGIRLRGKAFAEENGLDADFMDELLREYVEEGKMPQTESERVILDNFFAYEDNEGIRYGARMMESVNAAVWDETGIDVLSTMKRTKGEDWNEEELNALHILTERLDFAIRSNEELKQNIRQGRIEANDVDLGIQGDEPVTPQDGGGVPPTETVGQARQEYAAEFEQYVNVDGLIPTTTLDGKEYIVQDIENESDLVKIIDAQGWRREVRKHVIENVKFKSLDEWVDANKKEWANTQTNGTVAEAPTETVEQAGAEYNNALSRLLALDGGTEMRNRIDGLILVEYGIDEEFVSEFIGSYGALGEELYNACMDYAKAEAKRRAVEAKAQQAADDIQQGYGETFEPAVNEDGRLTMGVYDGQSVVIKNWDNESDLVKILDARQNETTVRKADIENINLGMPFDEWVRMNTAGRVQTIFNNVNIAYQPQESVGGGLGMPQGVNGEGGAKPAEDGGPTDFPQGEIHPKGDNSPTPPTEPENIAPTEPQQPRTEGGMPLYKEGGKLKPDFKNATSEETYNYLYGERKMNRDDINAFVRNKVSDAEKRLKKLEGKRPKMGTDLDEFEDKVSQWEKDKTDTQKELDYWNDVQRRAKQENLDEQRENADLAAQWKKVAALDDAVSLHEYLMRQVYGGLKFIWENNENGTKGLGAHLGLGDGAEKRSRRWMIGKQENGAMYPEKAAEVLAERYSADTGNEVEYDDVFNTLLDILRGYDRKSVLGNDILKEHNAGQFNEDTFNKEDEKRSKDAWAVEQGFEDYAAYEDYMKSLEGTERPQGESNGTPPAELMGEPVEPTDLKKPQEPQAKEEPATPTEPAAEPQGTVENTGVDLDEVRRIARGFAEETPEQAAAFDKRIPDMSDEELLAYIREDGKGDVNKAYHMNLYDEYDSRHGDEELEARDYYFENLQNNGTTLEQAEEMLANIRADKESLATDMRPSILGQTDALSDYTAELRKQEEQPAEPKGTFNPIEEAKKNVEEKEKKGTGKTSANGEKKEAVSATDKVVKDFMDAYRAWGKNIDDSETYRNYKAASDRLHEVLRTMSEEELVKLPNGNAVVKQEVDEEVSRRLGEARVRRTYEEGIEKQGDISGQAKAPKIVADDFSDKEEVRIALNGIFHDGEDGVGVVSDGNILIADKNLYDDSQKGKIILLHKANGQEKGTEVEAKYPKWRMVLGYTEGKVKASVEWNGLRNFLAGAEDVLKERWKKAKESKETKGSFKSWSSEADVLIKMPDGSINLYNYNKLRMFADAAAEMGMTNIYYGADGDQSMETANERGAILLMPKKINGRDTEETFGWGEDAYRLYFDWSDKSGVSQQKVEGETTESKAEVVEETPNTEEEKVNEPTNANEESAVEKQPKEEEKGEEEPTNAVEEKKEGAKKEKPSKVNKIEDFGEKIGGARKDVARGRIRDTVNMSVKDLSTLKNGAEDILSQKNIIRLFKEGQMDENTSRAFLAYNNLIKTINKVSPIPMKEIALKKYRDAAVAWEEGKLFSFNLTQEDIDKYKEAFPHATEERIREVLDYRFTESFNMLINTYKAIDYPAVNRKVGQYVIEDYTLAKSLKIPKILNNPYWLKNGLGARRGFPFPTFEAAVKRLLEICPVVEEKGKKEKGEKAEHGLRVVRDGAWYYVKSRNVPGNIYLSKSFWTEREAKEYLENNLDKLIEKEQRLVDALLGSNIGMAERVGVDYRDGKTVTPQNFLDEFGFRGVEFGNWVPQGERQMYLDKTYDAIMDFCAIIGISPKAFSLGGKLGLAFGARGHSKAMAHYEPAKVVINLTRMNGVGSLAHEWFHALDNYLAKEKTGNMSDMATKTHDVVREELSNVFKEMYSTMRQMDYNSRSRRAGEYWDRTEEEFARLFENYIYNKLEEKETQSPLLVRQDVLYDDVDEITQKYWPYPSIEENAQMKPLFDKLFETIQEKTDEDGNVVLFREGNGKIEATPDLGYTKKQAERYREREQKRMRGHVAEMTEKMHIADKVVIHDTAEGLKGRYATAKGWYDNKTGKIHVVIDNNRNIFDVMMTMMHEGVAHFGLRKMCGEHFDAFLDDVFANADESIKSAIRDKMDSMRNNDKNKKSEEAYRRAATEEYMADVAEQMEFSDAPPASFKSWWSKIKDLFLEMWGKLGLGKYFGPTITDNEIRYILWRSWQNLVNPGRYKNPFAVEEERAKAEERIEPKVEAKVETPKEDTQENVLVAADNTKVVGSNQGAKGFISTTQGDDYTFEQKTKMLDTYRMIKENYNAIALLNTPTGYVLINDGAKAARKVFGLDNNPFVVIDKEGLDEFLPRMIRAGYRLAIADVMTDNKVSEDDVDVLYNTEAESTDKEYADAVKNRDDEKVEQMIADAAKVAMPNTKIVDENGNPKVVYHGSKLAEFYYKDGYPYTRWIDRFNVFNEGKGYFTDNEQDAKNVGSGNRGLYKCYLNISKPYVFDAKGARWDDIEFNGEKYRTTDTVVKWAREQGEYDGVIIKNVIEPETQNPKPITDYVAFSPNQIKSAMAEYDDNGNLIPLSEKFNEDSDDIRFRDGEEEVDDIFVSNALRAVDGIKQEKATPEQWLKMIEKAGGLKAGEDKWMGLSDWLKGSDKKTLTKQEVQDFIRQNQIEIQEVHYADNTLGRYDKHWDYLHDWLIENTDRPEEWYSTLTGLCSYNDYNGFYLTHPSIRQPKVVMDMIERVNKSIVLSQPINSVRLGYTTKGLENKREIALVVPSIDSWNASDNIHFGDAGEGRAIAWIRFGDAFMFPEFTDKKQEANDALVSFMGEMYAKYNEKRWEDIPLTREERKRHAQLKENVKNTDTRILVIDEIQSKRHQEGREKGYWTKERQQGIEKLAREYQKNRRAYGEYEEKIALKYNVFNGESLTSEDVVKRILDVATPEEIEHLKELRDAELSSLEAKENYEKEHGKTRKLVPDAPFDKNWHELAMKRMLRYAAENGYDKIAWTTGEQQAKRYDLSQKVDEIKVIGGVDNIFTVIGRKDGGILVQKDVEGEKGIAELIGKEMARKAYSNLKEGEEDYLNEDGAVSFTGDDLQIGGEGMRGFYDQMLPRFMDKYGKKWGVKTGKIKPFGLDEMWAVDVTPEMKASVMQGQTMFRKGNEDVPNAVTDEMRTTAEQLATKLGVKVNIVDDVNSITHGNKQQQERRRNAKGWYNTATGEVTIVLPNNRNVDDVVATTLHEVVAHKGLREMVGEERYNEFLDEIYSHLNDELKEKVDKDAFNMFMNGLGKSKDTMKEHRRVAVDEMLGKLAEKGFEDFTESEKSIWQKLKEAVLKILDKFLDTLKLPKWFTLGDNELRYILWRSKERMERGKESPLDMAKDNIKRRELKLNDGDLYSSTETDDIWNDNSLSMSEKIASVKVRLAQNQSDNKTLRNEALQQLGTSLSDLRKAMRLQRDFDQSTVKRVSDLARIMMKGGYLRGLGASDFDSILAAVKNSVGHDNVEGAVQKLMDIMIDNQLKNAEKVLKALETIRGKKVNESGVEVIGELDPRGQRMMEVFKKVRRWKPEDIENAINSALERMGSDDNAVAEEAANEYAGLMLAQNYVDTIIASEVEEAELRKEIKETHDNASESDRRTPAYRDLIRSLNDAIRENKIERAEAYIDLAQRMGADLKQSIENAKDFKEAEKMRVNEIRHNANSDMEGRPAKEHYKPKFMDKFVNNSFVQFLFAPLSTFEQMMRLFGRKSADGEGYLYNRYMRGWVDARQKEIKGVREKFAILDDKAKELFGGKVKSWGDLIRYVGKLPKGEVVFKNGGNEEVYTMTQGNLLYIYMIDKMLDGQMKLRKMGITEADVEEIAENIDSRLLALGDWLQNEFLVDCRNEYNETHKRVFGASMAAIENYFPLKILKNALNDKAEDLDKPQYTDGITTITGSIIKRKRNTNPIDIFNADALNLILEHVANMEHWNAFTEFNRDLNTLRTYKRFRNQVFNMTTIYGSGKELWDKFNNVCQMAAGTYKPPRAKFDEAAVNFAKGVTASKVSFRLYTAIKQLASMPAYIPDTRADFLLKNILMPKKAWDWSMENLPIFNERWKSRLSGNPRLLKSDMDWRMWRTRIVELASRVGMSPNAFVDAVTVSIGAHAIYETRYNRYMKEGYEPEVAHKKALQDAEIGYNLTQQSSEGAFTSTIQVDRSWLSVLFSIFRNASMSYQRQLHNSLRNFKKNLGTVGKETSVEFMTKQFVREGMDADTAEANARRRFNRQMLRDALSVATFGCIMQLCWNIFKYLPYLLFGDDDTEKDKMWNDIMAQTVAAPVEGLTGGDVYSELVRMAITGEGSPAHASKDMPITSDATYMLEKIWQGKSDEALSDMVNIIVASGVGINPQTITDTVLAIMDACGDDPALAHEATLFAFRVLQVPQSQIDKLYFDEVGLSGEEASKYSMEELAERYARYKVKRGRFFAPWSWDDKEALGKAKKKAQKAIKERVDRLGGKEQNDKYAEYEEKYKAIADEVKAAKEVGEKNKKKGDAMLDALYNDKEKKGLYDTFKKLDKGLDDLAKRYLKAINENEAELYHNAIEEYKQLAVKVLESPDSISREKNEKELKALLDRVFKEMKEIEE